MSTSLRIEELKKKFDENPRRYFAPLANEYRKAGDLQQAISICQAHLPQQPGHMSGHIVYGQALFEARQFEQARTVFETALALDPENLIALRYLGDIAFELGDRGGARGWYTRVLETDPRNEEIAALMAAMGADERASASRDDRERVESEPEQDEVDGAPAGADDTVSQPAATAGTAEDRNAVVSSSPEAPLDVRSHPDAAAEERPREGGDRETEAELERLFSKPAPRESTTQPPSVRDEPSITTFPGVEPKATPWLEERAPALSEGGERGPAAAVPSQGEGVPFVTETMAELYVKQGYHEKALTVYQQLIAQNPDDGELRQRMERVEADARAAATGPSRSGGSGEPTVREFLARIGRRGVGGHTRGGLSSSGGSARSSDETRQADGRERSAANGSIDALFGGAKPSGDDVTAATTLADAFGGGPTAASEDPAVGGRPAHQAPNELSLDSVFRDSVGTAAGRSADASTVSYDQFFSPQAPTSHASGGEAVRGSERASGSDDIEQFNAWLQGLKKR